MKALKKQILFTCSNDGDLSAKVIEYFKKSGFKQVDRGSSGSKLVFERGSLFTNMVTFNPLNWKSEIEIFIEEEHVSANFHIDAIGQIPTSKDERLWDIFIGNFQKYLCDVNFDFQSENNALVRQTKSKNLTYIGWTLLGAVFGGIPAGFIAHSTGIHVVAAIGASLGAIAFLMMKIYSDKPENGSNIKF